MLEKNIVSKRKEISGFMNFLKDFSEAVKDGWEPNWDNFVNDSKPHINHGFRVVVFKKDPDDIKKELFETVDESLLEDNKAKKEDLILLAQKHNVNLSDDQKKYPAAIKKAVREAIKKEKSA